MLSGTYVPNILAFYLLQFNMWMKWMVDYAKYLVWVPFSCRDLCKQPIFIRAGGGIYNYLYQLRSSSDEASQTKSEGSNILGKFQITWRTNLGEPGRLQTQNIHSTVSDIPASDLIILCFVLNFSILSYSDIEPKVILLLPYYWIASIAFNICKSFFWQPTASKDVDLRAVKVPPIIYVERAFLVNNPDWYFFQDWAYYYYCLDSHLMQFHAW